MTTATAQTIPPMRARRFRLSLRLMMLAIVVLSSWMAWKTNKARRTRRAIEQIRVMRGQFAFDDQAATSLPYYYRVSGVTPPRVANREWWGERWLRQRLGDEYFREVIGVRLFGSAEQADFSREGLAPLEAFSRLRVLELINAPNLGDAGLDNLKSVTGLERLVIATSRVTDAGLAKLARMHRLRMLSVSDAAISDAGLSSLSQLASLQVLNLGGNKISDAGLLQLGGLSQLQELYLFRTAIGDEGLIHLRRFPSLRLVDLRATQVTKEGIARLKAERPNLQIKYP